MDDKEREAKVRSFIKGATFYKGRPECTDEFLLRLLDEERAKVARLTAKPHEGHNEPCYYCGEPCDDLVGNPSLWSVVLCHSDDPGVAKYHHVGCVSDRLEQLARLTAPPGASALERADQILEGWLWEQGVGIPEGLISFDEAKKRIARALEAAERDATERERERCAQLCDEAMDKAADREYDDLAQQASDLADVIRAEPPQEHE